jgi:DNA-binding CsgD family transcriptional regulator
MEEIQALADEEIESVRRLGRLGLSAERIAKRFHVDRWTINMVLQLMD